MGLFVSVCTCICLVQLNPPCNLSVKWNEQEGTLLLYWNSSTPLKETCVVYMVRNQKDISQVRLETSYDDHFTFKLPSVSSSSLFCSQTTNVTGKSYSLSQVSQNKPYVFQVRSTVSNICGGSDLWSNWSDPIKWGSTGEMLLLYSDGLVMDGFPLISLLTVFPHHVSLLFREHQQTRLVGWVVWDSGIASAASTVFVVVLL